jgi:hypothetical protein
MVVLLEPNYRSFVFLYPSFRVGSGSGFVLVSGYNLYVDAESDAESVLDPESQKVAF